MSTKSSTHRGTNRNGGEPGIKGLMLAISVIFMRDQRKPLLIILCAKIALGFNLDMLFYCAWCFMAAVYGSPRDERDEVISEILFTHQKFRYSKARFGTAAFGDIKLRLPLLMLSNIKKWTRFIGLERKQRLRSLPLHILDYNS